MSISEQSVVLERVATEERNKEEVASIIQNMTGDGELDSAQVFLYLLIGHTGTFDYWQDAATLILQAIHSGAPYVF